MHATAATDIYFDGLTATAWPVGCRFDGQTLAIEKPDGATIRWRREEMFLAAPPAPDIALSLGRGEERLELRQPALVAAIVAASPQLQKSLDKFRPWTLSRWLGGAAAAAAMVLVVFLALRNAPGAVAPLVPYGLEAGLGNRLVATADVGSYECDSVQAKAALKSLVDRLAAAADWPHPIQVHLVNISLPNAVALPGGHVVVFRGLIDHAGSGDEVAGVIGHEVGHVVRRHSMQQVVRELGLSLIVNLVTGGATGDINTTLIGYGGTVWQLSYSRAAELEADDFAIAALGKAGLRSDGLQRFFATLDAKGIGAAPVTWLSTHPATPDRVKALQDRSSATGAAAFSDAEWDALKGPCHSLRRLG